MFIKESWSGVQYVWISRHSACTHVHIHTDTYTMETPFNVRSVSVFSSCNVQLQSSQTNNLNVKLTPFQIFCSLMFRSSASKGKLNGGFTVQKWELNDEIKLIYWSQTKRSNYELISSCFLELNMRVHNLDFGVSEMDRFDNTHLVLWKLQLRYHI